MRVCVVDPSLFTLAYDQHLCSALGAAGEDVTLCGRALRSDETAAGARFVFDARCYRRTERGASGAPSRARVWLKALEHVHEAGSLGRWLRDSFDVVHFQWSPVPAWDHRVWRSIARHRAVVFTVHDTTPFLGRPTHRLQQMGWHDLLEVADGLIVHTETSRDTLEARGIPRTKMRVIPHGPLFAAERGACRPSAAASPAASGVRTLLVFGEIKPYKGIDVLLSALARLPRAVRDGWRVVIAGRPRCEMEPLQALAARAGVPVEWRLGYVPEAQIPTLFAEADLVVFPYRQIDASGALMLALPFGVPIVASRIGVFAEILADEETAMLAAPGDECDLARVLARAMADDVLRTRLRTRALAVLGTRFSWQAIAGAHREFYRELVERRRGPMAAPSSTRLSTGAVADGAGATIPVEQVAR